MGKQLETVDELMNGGAIGDWCFSADGRTIYFNYPIKSSYEGEPDYPDIVRIPVHRAGEIDERTEISWEWDGNREAPTISPSVNVIGRWHGFFRAGKIETV